MENQVAVGGWNKMEMANTKKQVTFVIASHNFVLYVIRENMYAICF
jgi:hypothetical protein